MNRKLPLIEIGYHVFVRDGGEEVGAVREVAPGGRPEIVINVENAGDFIVALDSIKAVHSQKVILDAAKIGATLKNAIGHAHDREDS
jgi:hypothetical protein